MEGEAPGPDDAAKQVTLMTLHKAKGLEFPVVILSGAGSDRVRPNDFILDRHRQRAHLKAGTKDLGLWTLGHPKALEEEQSQEAAENLRLLYVGCTRARDSLVLPFSKQDKAATFLKPLLERIGDIPTTSLDLSSLKVSELRPSW